MTVPATDLTVATVVSVVKVLVSVVAGATTKEQSSSGKTIKIEKNITWFIHLPSFSQYKITMIQKHGCK